MEDLLLQGESDISVLGITSVLRLSIMTVMIFGC